MTNLLVLAGGFGTRLRSAVADVPKPLAPVAGKPYLQYLIEHWVKQDVSEFTFLLHYQAEMIEEFLSAIGHEDHLSHCQFRTLIEPNPLGTGGAVAFAVRELAMKGTFLVANADTWLGSGIQQLVLATAPCIGVIKVDNPERYGGVEFKDGKVVAFKEKQKSLTPGWISSGLYHLNCDAFDRWDNQPYSLEQGVFPQLVRDNRLNAIVLNTDFIDIGIPEDYFRFCQWVESNSEGLL